jgi:hypothetical protein
MLLLDIAAWRTTWRRKILQSFGSRRRSVSESTAIFSSIQEDAATSGDLVQFLLKATAAQGGRTEQGGTSLLGHFFGAPGITRCRNVKRETKDDTRSSASGSFGVYRRDDGR